MSSDLIFTFEPELLGALVGLRLARGVEVAISAEPHRLWLRCPAQFRESVGVQLAVLPAQQRFELDDNLLTPIDHHLPAERLPEELAWSPIRDAFPIQSSESIEFSQPPSERPPLRLVRSTSPDNETLRPRLLLTDLDSLIEMIDKTAETRFSHLEVAVCQDRQVLVFGEPLPPLPGVRMWVQEGVACPLGWTWAPALAASVVRQGVPSCDLLVLSQNGEAERLLRSNFVKATRSALRRSALNLQAAEEGPMATP